MIPSSYPHTAIAVSRFGRRAAGFVRSCACRRNSRSIALQIAIRNRRPRMLSIICNARTSGVMPTPHQLRSYLAAKTP
jgi:hypothetical protein